MFLGLLLCFYKSRNSSLRANTNFQNIVHVFFDSCCKINRSHIRRDGESWIARHKAMCVTIERLKLKKGIHVKQCDNRTHVRDPEPGDILRKLHNLTHLKKCIYVSVWNLLIWVGSTTIVRYAQNMTGTIINSQ